MLVLIFTCDARTTRKLDTEDVTIVTIQVQFSAAIRSATHRVNTTLIRASACTFLLTQKEIEQRTS